VALIWNRWTGMVVVAAAVAAATAVAVEETATAAAEVLLHQFESECCSDLILGGLLISFDTPFAAFRI
jgi:hypothetical protein